MPTEGQKYAAGLTYSEAIEEFGEAAVHALGRLDNLRARGLSSHGLVQLLRDRQRDGGIVSRLDPVKGRPVPALLRPPEGAMDDPTFLEAWRLVCEIWQLKHRGIDEKPWGELMDYIRRLYHSAVSLRIGARRKPRERDTPDRIG